MPGELYHLPNALPVLVIPDKRFPLVSIRLYAHAGSAYETDAQAGISHLLEHMVFKGTPSRPKGQISKEVENLGGYLNAATSYDYTVYIVDLPSNHWSRGLDIVHDMVFNATIDPAELESEKQVVISELERNEDNPANYLFQKITQSALKGSPYARPIIGYRETVSSFTREDIKNYVNTWYQPQSMLLVVCGDVKTEAVLTEAEKLFGNLHNSEVIPFRAPIDPARLKAPGHSAVSADAGLHKGPSVFVEKRPLNKVYFNIAFPVPGYQSDEDPTLEILAGLLGGDPTSLFYRTYKYEKQLVDNISVYYYNFEGIGLIYCSALVDADKFNAFWQEFSKDLPTVSAADFNEEELARIKLNIEDSLFRSKETIAGIASKAGYFFMQGGSLMAERDYLTALRAVTLQDVDKAIKTWFRPEALSIAALSPEEFYFPDFEGDLQKNWPVKEQAEQQNTPLEAGAAETVEIGPGRTLIMLPDPTLPYISLNLAFTGGDLLLQADEQGLNDLAASALTRGTKEMNAPELEVYLAERAASLSASAGKKTFNLGSSFPVRFKNDMFNLVRSTLDNPAFSPEEVEREKNNQIAAIRTREDQPLGLAFRRLMPFLFPDQVQGYFRMGTPESVAAYTPEQVKAYWGKQMQQPWVLAVCGDFNREEVIEFAESLPAPTAKTPVMTAPKWNADKELNLHMPGRNQSHIMLVFKTTGSKDPDNPKLDLLNTYLSGMGGMLFTELRDKQGLGYTVTSIKWQSEETGLLAFYIGTDPDKTETALDGFKKIIHQLQAQPLNPEDLQGAANQMEGEYYRNHQSLGSRAMEAASLSILNYPLDYALNNIEQAKAATPGEIQELANKYLNWDEAYIIRVDP
ncbi:MAG: insulinase family protein [Desulfovibrionaceae bacterium]|nr:insulinase family protein [Desulfovibrionaceae bacterium]